MTRTVNAGANDAAHAGPGRLWWLHLTGCEGQSFLYEVRGVDAVAAILWALTTVDESVTVDDVEPAP